MDNTVLADSISNIPHLQAFDLMWGSRLSNIELEALLVYLIDIVSPEALPYLANQFDVEGDKGYRLATTDYDKRQIIKKAIELKRYIGTVWAIKEAIKSVGYADADLIEGVDQGTPDVDWAKFRVETDLGNDKGFNVETAVELTKLINYYKNARSHLLDISFRTSVVDTLEQLYDTFNLEFHAPALEENLGWVARFLDGTYSMNGSVTAIEGNDNLIVNLQSA